MNMKFFLNQARISLKTPYNIMVYVVIIETSAHDIVNTKTQRLIGAA